MLNWSHFVAQAEGPPNSRETAGPARGLREAMDDNTVVGRFRVDRDGVQLAHKRVLFQWQDGKKVIVWPEELAPNQPRFPTPPWSQR